MSESQKRRDERRRQQLLDREAYRRALIVRLSETETKIGRVEQQIRVLKELKAA